MIRYWVEADTPLPAADRDVPGHPGLIALGADLGPDRLVEAYTQGLFPWYSAGQPVLWWSPDPRMVVFVDEFSPSRSLRRLLARLAASGHPGPASPVSPSASQGAPTQAPPAAPRWQITLDTAFADVMQACAEPRPGQDGTWITPAIQAAYTALHQRGLAHSLEVREDGQLIAGLYGVSIGRMFFGESMFTRRPNASKCAFATLMHLLASHGFPLVDCQQSTRHLGSLGGRDISRADFLVHIRPLLAAPAPDWPARARDSAWPDFSR